MSQIQKDRQSQRQQRLSVATNIQRKTQKVLRIHADDYSNKHLVIFWLIYIGIIILVSLLTLALPPTFIKLNNQVSLAGTSLYDCNNPMGFNMKDDSLYCNNVTVTNPTAGLVLRDLTTRNQFFLVYVNLVIENKADPLLQFKSDIHLKLNQLAQRQGKNGIQFYNKNQVQNQLIPNWQFSSNDNVQRIYESNGYSFKGYRTAFAYQKYIEQQDSLLQISFKNWPITNLKNFYMDVIGVNGQFTVFAILIRYIFFAISVGAMVGYYVRYRTIPDHLKTLQQKMIMYLSVFTIMFNDPLYAATIMAPNGFTAFTSVAFIVNFLTYLIAFWMIFIDRILYQSGQKYQNVINKKKIVYIVALYLSLFILQFQMALIRLSDVPIVSSNAAKKGSIVAFQIIAFMLFAGGLIYICVQFCRASVDFFNKIWRNQMFLMFSFIYIILIIFMLIVSGFGVYEYAGNRILILYTFMNMYTYYLQYMYTVTRDEANNLDRSRIMGENMGNEVETIISNFGNDEIMVDLDSEPGSEIYHGNNNNNGFKMNEKYQNQIEENKRKQQSENNPFEDQTMDNLNNMNLPKKEEQKKQNFDSFEMDD